MLKVMEQHAHVLTAVCIFCVCFLLPCVYVCVCVVILMSLGIKIGDTLFVHGGLRPVNLDPKNCKGATGMACLENINRSEEEEEGGGL